MARIIKTLILLVSLFTLGLIFVDYGRGFYNDYMEEYEGTASTVGKDVIVEIPQGASAKEIATILKKKGLIDYPSAFTRRLQKSEYRGKLKSGTFTLNTGMNTLEMMEAMSPVIDEELPIATLVVPEGFSVEMIARRCENKGICTEREFLNAVEAVTVEDFPYLADVPADANIKYKLQGYLFPATYDIYESTTPESLVKWMLDTFNNYYTADLKMRAEVLGYTSFDVVNRASIIEREAKIDEERPIIAGVINNRLAEGMQLQMCPTVLYPITEGMYDQDKVYYKDLDIESAYNTYRNSGLPVGPICNPGIACINAVLYPADTTYLYYHVSEANPDEHVFTETFEEHNNPQIIGEPDEEEEQ